MGKVHATKRRLVVSVGVAESDEEAPLVTRAAATQSSREVESAANATEGTGSIKSIGLDVRIVVDGGGSNCAEGRAGVVAEQDTQNCAKTL
jgi:hypothetical protein